MVDSKPITAWALLSLVSSILGWFVGLPLVLIDYNHLIGATAGVGVLGPLLLGLLSATLCLLAIIFGVVAVARIRRGERRGRGILWAGIILGGLPLIAYVVLGRYLLGWW
jgi:hypothetical protein